MHAGGHARVRTRLSHASCTVRGSVVRWARVRPERWPSDPGKSHRPTTTIMPSHSNISLSSTKTVTPSTFGADKPGKRPPGQSSSRIPVTPAVLRGIFASSRTVFEERSISRAAFFRQVSPLPLLQTAHQVSSYFLCFDRFSAFLVSCLAISLFAARGRVVRNGVTLLGAVNKQ